MSLFVNRYVALTFEDEARCVAFHKRTREMFVQNSSNDWTYGDIEEITLDAVGEDEVDWRDQLGYVFKGCDEEERLVRIWTMGNDEGTVKLSFKDMFEPDARTLLIVGEQSCWGPVLFSCYRQYLDGDFGLERVKVLLWCEDNSAEVWCQDCDGGYFYNKLDADSFASMRQELAEEQGLEKASDIEDAVALVATGVLDENSEYSACCDELDNIDMDQYPVFYDASESGSHDDVADDGEGGVTYQDVFDRVKGYLEKKGYYPKVNEKDGSVSMSMDGNGATCMLWDSVEDFLAAPWEDGRHAEFDTPGCANIFEIADVWESKYDDLLRWPAEFIDNCGALAQINYSDLTPAGLMQALDDANFGEEDDEDDGYDEEVDDVAEETDDEVDDEVVSTSNVTDVEERADPVRQGQRFCEQCGAALEVGSAFCTECGASIDDAPVRSDGERTFYLPGWMRKASW